MYKFLYTYNFIYFYTFQNIGMDPFARRQMWDVIAAVSEDRSVILTTHSMEVLTIIYVYVYTYYFLSIVDIYLVFTEQIKKYI